MFYLELDSASFLVARQAICLVSKLIYTKFRRNHRDDTFIYLCVLKYNIFSQFLEKMKMFVYARLIRWKFKSELKRQKSV